MKRVNNIFEKITTIENLRLAHKNARKGKTHYQEVKQVDKYEDHYLQRLRRLLLQKTFKNSSYETFKKIDKGKERLIFKLPYFPDRILHHAILQVIEPIWKKMMIKDTYQSIKGRGVHQAKKRVEKALRSHKKDERIYCLKLDIHKFYPSINNDILFSLIERKIKDKDVLWLLKEIIYSTQGVPIGNYLSQYFGNIYLTYFDHWIKEKIKIKHYFRYCDDIVIIHADKDYLSYLFTKIEYYLEKNLNLKVKSNYQVFPIHARRIDFLGFVFDKYKTYTRKRIARNFKRKVILFYKYRRGTFARAIASYHGWFKNTDSWPLWNKYVTNFKEIKQKI